MKNLILWHRIGVCIAVVVGAGFFVASLYRGMSLLVSISFALAMFSVSCVIAQQVIFGFDPENLEAGDGDDGHQ